MEQGTERNRAYAGRLEKVKRVTRPWGMCRDKRGRCVYRGGNWNNGTNAGVFYLNGNNSRSNSNTNIGFRSALALFAYVLRATALQEHKGKRDAFPGRQGQRSEEHTSELQSRF